MSAYLCTPLGSEEFLKEFVTKKVQEWSEQLLELAHIATIQPHAHSLLMGMNICTTLVKNLGRTFTSFLEEFSKNLARILQESWQDYCKIVVKNI